MRALCSIASSDMPLALLGIISLGIYGLQHYDKAHRPCLRAVSGTPRSRFFLTRFALDAAGFCADSGCVLQHTAA